MSDELLLEIKPKFIIPLRLIMGFGKSIIIACVFSYFLLMILPMLIVTFNENSSFAILVNNTGLYFVYYMIIFAIFLVFSALLNLFIDQHNYEATNYKIYNDRIEFEEGFINHKFTTLKIENIKEIHLLQNFIQRKYGVSTIKFITSANNGSTNSGISFTDIENAQYIYTKMKQLQEEGYNG